MSMKLSQTIMLKPHYELYFNNASKPLHDNLKKYITLIEYEESDGEADLARITVSDVDFIFSNSIGLTRKMPVKLRMGFEGKMRTMIEGEVTHIEANFGEDGVPTLVIGVVDNTNKMTTEKKSRKWKKVRASDVVTKIAKEYGFIPVVTHTDAILDEVSQEDETDAQLLMKLAEDEGFQCYIIPATKKLYFGDRLTDVTPVDTVYYNSGDYTVRYFRPNLVEKNKPENVSSKEGNVSDKTGEAIEKTTKSSSAPSSTSNQSTKQYTIDTVTGALERER